MKIYFSILALRYRNPTKINTNLSERFISQMKELYIMIVSAIGEQFGSCDQVP
jgi:hypothetical protein